MARRRCCHSPQQPLQDEHHLSAAEGWLELGNYLEANSELESIAPANHALPAVLKVRYGLFAAAKNWPLAYEIASTLSVMTPCDPNAWLHSSYALHELKFTHEARDKLAAVASMFPDHAVMRYNLACYECQLGNLSLARDWLSQAFDLPCETDLRTIALDDPDLEPLWSEMEI